MKKYLTIAALCFAALTTTACGQRIKFDEAAVEVIEVGSKAGVQEQEISTGRYWKWPWSLRYIVKFPTPQQTYSFSAKDGNCFAFISKDQIRTVMCASMNVKINADDADNIVRTYKGAIKRGGDGYVLDDVINGPVRREMQQAFAFNGVNYTSAQLYADGGRSLLETVNAAVAPKFSKNGIIIEQIMPNGVPILPEPIVASIQGTLQAKIDATKAEAELQKTVALGAKRKADSDADAYVLATEGKAIRENPEILRKLAIERNWGLCPEGAEVCVIGAQAAAIAQTFDQDGKFK